MLLLSLAVACATPALKPIDPSAATLPAPVPGITLPEKKAEAVTPPNALPPPASVIPVPAPAPIVIPAPPIEKPVLSSPTTAADYFKDIQDLAAGSRCAVYSWKDQGQAPVGFIKGIALVYARSVCNKTRADVKIVSQVPTIDWSFDALSFYGAKTEAGISSLRKTYTLLFGLGMRESSGKYCTGRDMRAGYSTADSAEAGLFQTSWGSRLEPRRKLRVEALADLYAAYKSGKMNCLLDVFKEGIDSCATSDAKNWGNPSDDGFEWQRFTKACPAFAAEWAAVVTRVNGGNFGEFQPIRTKAAELVPECENLLLNIEKIVEAGPEVCNDL